MDPVVGRQAYVVQIESEEEDCCWGVPSLSISCTQREAQSVSESDTCARYNTATRRSSTRSIIRLGRLGTLPPAVYIKLNTFHPVSTYFSSCRVALAEHQRTYFCNVDRNLALGMAAGGGRCGSQEQAEVGPAQQLMEAVRKSQEEIPTMKTDELLAYQENLQALRLRVLQRIKKEEEKAAAAEQATAPEPRRAG